MGFSYRKSVKMGPFRVTASKSGISYSAGVKGARVTKRANGKVQANLSVPGTGVRYTTSTKSKRAVASPSAAKRAAPAKAAVRTPPAAAPKPAPAAKQARAARSPRPPKPAPAPRPARAPKPARPGKPVKLRGKRSTTPPVTLPPWVLPLSIKGNLATVTLHQTGIHIERTRAGKINGNHSSDIAWHEIAGIDFLDPNFFRNGHVHFATPGDPRGLTSTGNGNRMAASARNPHAILFTLQQSRAYNQLRDLLTGRAHIPPPPLQQPAWQQPTWQQPTVQSPPRPPTGMPPGPQPQPTWQTPTSPPYQWPPRNHL